MVQVHALIIDDNHLNSDVLVTLLEREGAQWTSVDSVRKVPDVLNRSSRIDIIFLDLEFPNGDGFDLLTTLKSDLRLSGVPIVAYTVHTSEIDRARRSGFHSFLAKPIDAKRFSGLFRRILNNESVWEI